MGWSIFTENQPFLWASHLRHEHTGAPNPRTHPAIHSSRDSTLTLWTHFTNSSRRYQSHLGLMVTSSTFDDLRPAQNPLAISLGPDLRTPLSTCRECCRSSREERRTSG
ncbi:hypothetical protein RSAG8_12644, partial [Rhizoctonia solani AG-8 WAC10335]